MNLLITGNMIRQTRLILILLLAALSVGTVAQNRQVSYFMNIPQNQLANPAIKPLSSVYIGLPGISGASISVNNNFLKFSNIFMKGKTNDSVLTFLHPDFNVDDFLSGTNDKNSIEPQISLPVLSVGFAAGRSGYFSLDIIDRVDANIVLPGDLFELALKGNEGFAGSKIDLSSLRGDIKYYRESGFGYSRQITPRLRMGVRAKVLFGVAAVSIENKALSVTVNEDYSHVIDADLRVNIAAPLKVTKEANGDINSIEFDDSVLDSPNKTVKYVLNTDNMGFGIDLGATYDVSARFKVSAALTDFGYIKWKRDVTNLVASNKFVFNGLDLSRVIDGTKTFDEVGNEMIDSLKNAFKVSETNESFTTYLPFGLTVGGCYSLTPDLSLGVLSYTRFIGEQVKEALTLSANANIGTSFSASLSYTAINNSYDNIGAGLAFRAGFVQFYMLTDMIPFSWNKIIVDNGSVPLPVSFNTLNLRLGMNLVFGNRIKEEHDKPIISVE
jgi:hypothetical protein